MHKISTSLLEWYDEHHRDLPWRLSPKAQASGQKPDPYRVWLSEIMLQQTVVTTVQPYFKKFLTFWPNIETLAHATQEEILAAWAGLGYYARGRNLKTCAQQILNLYGGQFPQDVDTLKTLPGIGDYTAAAIAAIAFDKPVAVVDANVERVISRLFAITTPLPKAKAEIRFYCQSITPQKRPGDFSQAMMDLGAKICTPKKPRCSLCPLQKFCRVGPQSAHQAQPENFPARAPKKPRPTYQGAAFILLNEKSNIYLEKRHEKGLLGGMTQIPNHFGPTYLANHQSDMVHAPLIAQWRFVGTVQHVFTHFSLHLNVYKTEIMQTQIGNGWWCAQNALAQEALPSLMKKAIKVGLPEAFN
ncbi:A/G-specific adenine glycosylase [Bartonella sp. DGB2]|uniref:A/G-specific adenine glycosylase n=1 Tax=Bartonella sp. DGB2 TaxID=3388426 RepID=UPI00398FFD70